MDGTYVGTFQREPDGQVAQVSMVFMGGGWTGTSQMRNYPALCSGTYEVNGNGQISFANSCFWTADFDWTLVLGGTYELSGQGNSVVLTKQRADKKDIYRLRKQ